MTSPLKSVLITAWTKQHLTGFDLDGGALTTFNLDPALIYAENLGDDAMHWRDGDIATLRVNPETHLAHLRIVTPRSSIVRTRDCEIFDIAHTTDDTAEDIGRHIYLKGTAENGAIYIMPMLGYTVWRSAWDFSNLQQALEKAQSQPHTGQPPTTLSFTCRTEAITTGDGLKAQIEHYNHVFYPGSRKDGTVLDKATSLTTTCFSMTQTGPAKRATMHVATFVKKLKPDAKEKLDTEIAPIKMGTAFSQPYFVIDGQKVFIRTSGTV